MEEIHTLEELFAFVEEKGWKKKSIIFQIDKIPGLRESLLFEDYQKIEDYAGLYHWAIREGIKYGVWPPSNEDVKQRLSRISLEDTY